MRVLVTIPYDFEKILTNFKEYNDIKCLSTAVMKLAEIGARTFFNDEEKNDDVKNLNRRIEKLETLITNMAADLARLTSSVLDEK